MWYWISIWLYTKKIKFYYINSYTDTYRTRRHENLISSNLHSDRYEKVGGEGRGGGRGAKRWFTWVTFIMPTRVDWVKYCLKSETFHIHIHVCQSDQQKTRSSECICRVTQIKNYNTWIYMYNLSICIINSTRYKMKKNPRHFSLFTRKYPMFDGVWEDANGAFGVTTLP